MYISPTPVYLTGTQNEDNPGWEAGTVCVSPTVRLFSDGEPGPQLLWDPRQVAAIPEPRGGGSSVWGSCDCGSSMVA